jgi:hypothetical protein
MELVKAEISPAHKKRALLSQKSARGSKPTIISGTRISRRRGGVRLLGPPATARCLPPYDKPSWPRDEFCERDASLP